MNFQNFLDELDTLQDEREEIIVRIKSHGLPVILYGAGVLAKRITRKLAAYGCEVAGYAVDDEYFTPNQTYLQRPVHRMADLIAHPNEYVFVLGVGVFNNNDRVTKLLNEHKITLYMLTEDNMALIDAEYILSERDRFSETFDMFADDLSRQTMLAYLRLKVSGNPLHCAAICKNGEYFNDLTARARGGIFVDCGAYRGDTIERFINWSGGHYTKIIAFEPDAENFAALENFVREHGYKNVILLNCGVYDRKDVLAFDSCGNESSALSAGGTASTAVEKIDDVVGSEPVSLIKMDVEGSELPALHGAASTITRDKPALAICAYHRAEDLITLPQYIKSLYGGYKFYLRRDIYFEHGLILYATP